MRGDRNARRLARRGRRPSIGRDLGEAAPRRARARAAARVALSCPRATYAAPPRVTRESTMTDARDPGSSEPQPVPTGEPLRGVARGDRVHAFTAPGIRVTWSRNRCTHVGECVM